MTTQSSSQILLALLRDIHPSARLDANDGDGETFEVRIFGAHVGFVRFNPDGSLGEWV